MESKASGDRIAVKFKRKIDLPYEEGAERAFAGAERQWWDELVREVGAIRLEPLFDIRREAVDALLELPRTTSKSSSARPTTWPHARSAG